MDPAVLRRTQDSLGKVIRKPPLTEKLLSKPPFRYLQDIITEVIRTTGFLKGLYTESDLKSDNVKDKDAKISFLQKAIDVVVLVTGEPLAVKPARIVAGHEPEKTNELLQALGKCCLSKLSSDDAVRRVLSGEKPDVKAKQSTVKSQDKENREAKEEAKKSHKEDKRETEIRERSGSRESKDRQQLKEDERKQTERDRERKKESEKDIAGETERDGLREGEQNDKERSRARESRTEAEKDRSKDKGRERGSRGKERTRERDKGKERDHEKDRNRDRESEREKRKGRGKDDEEKPPEPERAERKSKGSEDSLSKKPSEVSVKESKLAADKELSSSVKVARPSASKLRERRPARPSGEGEAASDGEGAAEPVTAENGEMSEDLPPNVAQRRIPRPGSARPAPPRVKRQESVEAPVQERVSSGRGISGVIVDKPDEDDEEFIVEEASPQLPDMPEMEMEQELSLSADEKHGGLVKKILETKKDYETQPEMASNKERLLVSDAGRRKEKDMVTKEIEKLRVSIQTLCRSALPLGKIMDYIQEDMDTMQNELQSWRRENRQHAEVLLREQSVTDTAVEPLKAELAELEQLIKEQQDKICTVKGNILRSDEKIQRMVQSINVSTRA
ncbi:TRAF3-interacting protein 1 [Discoglossus pictus]